MELFLRFLLTVVLGATGGVLAKKLRLPAAYMIGALIVVLVINLATSQLYFPRDLRTGVRLIAGSMIGSRVNRDNVRELRQVLVPGVMMLVYFMVLMVVNGLMLWKICGVDIATALFGSAPGGLTDMGLISGDFGANAAFVTVMQLVRLICVLFSYPFIFKYLAKRGFIATHNNDNIEGNEADAPDKKSMVRGTLILTVAGAVMGMLFYMVNFPAGTIVGAMLGSAAANIYFSNLRFDRRLRVITQICSGAYIGTIVTRADMSLIVSSLPAILLMVANMLTLPFIFGYLIHRLTKLELGTSLFCVTPGGLQELSLLAEDMGLDVPKISIIHTFRGVTVLALCPTLIRFILTLFSQ